MVIWMKKMKNSCFLLVKIKNGSLINICINKRNYGFQLTGYLFYLYFKLLKIFNIYFNCF
jgi:hypothetical protein